MPYRLATPQYTKKHLRQRLTKRSLSYQYFEPLFKVVFSVYFGIDVLACHPIGSTLFGMPFIATLGQPLPGLSSLSLQLGDALLEKADLILASPYDPPVTQDAFDHMVGMRQMLMTLIKQGTFCVVWMRPFEHSYKIDKQTPDETLVRWHNYSWLPVPPFKGVRPKKIIIEPSSFKPLLSLLEPFLSVNLAFSKPFQKQLMTDSDQHVLAGMSKIGKGYLICLPAVQWEHPKLLNSQNEEWTPLALTIGKQLFDFFVSMLAHVKPDSPMT